MIGSTGGASGENFTPDDARALEKWAAGQPWVCSLHFWAVSRDSGRGGRGGAAATQPWEYSRIFKEFTTAPAASPKTSPNAAPATPTAPATTAAPGPDNTPPAGFVALFNGKDLTGWTIPADDNGHWKVVNGVIDYDAQSQAPGDKSLWSQREYGNFVLHIDWRLKEAPYINKNVPYILPDGSHAHDIYGKEMQMSLPDADSGVFLRGDGRFQANIFCWPIGSGEFYGLRMDPKMPPEVRAAATPRTQADKPVGQWNHFEITAKGSTVSVLLNGKTVIPTFTIPDLPARGRLALQHHGGKNPDGAWNGPPSLVQFKNVYIKELSE